MVIHLLFTDCTCSPTYWTLPKQCEPHIMAFSICSLSEVRIVFWMLLQLDILCAMQWNETVLKITIRRLHVACFPARRSSWKQKKLTMKYMLFKPYSGELCNKNCVVKTSETLIIWRMSCYTA